MTPSTQASENGVLVGASRVEVPPSSLGAESSVAPSDVVATVVEAAVAESAVVVSSASGMVPPEEEPAAALLEDDSAPSATTFSASGTHAATSRPTRIDAGAKRCMNRVLIMPV